MHFSSVFHPLAIAMLVVAAPVQEQTSSPTQTNASPVPPSEFSQLSSPYINSANVAAVLGSSAGSVPVQTSAAQPKNFEMSAAQTRLNSGQINEIMGVVNHFDIGYKIPVKQWSDTLFNNAQKTGRLDDGENENHYLFPGTMAQVIVNGLNLNDTVGYSYAPFANFQAAYMDWLCEVPKDPQLHGKCPQVLSVTCEDVSGQTGHHAILTSKAYTKIGCAFTYRPGWHPNDFTHGLWVCDLA